MKRALAALLLVISGAALDRLSFAATHQAEAGVKVCARANGDVNADGRLDIGDA